MTDNDEGHWKIKGIVIVPVANSWLCAAITENVQESFAGRVHLKYIVFFKVLCVIFTNVKIALSGVA